MCLALAQGFYICSTLSFTYCLFVRFNLKICLLRVAPNRSPICHSKLPPEFDIIIKYRKKQTTQPQGDIKITFKYSIGINSVQYVSIAIGVLEGERSNLINLQYSFCPFSDLDKRQHNRANAGK